MIDCFGFCVNQQLAQSGIVPEKPIIGETVKPEAVIVRERTVSASGIPQRGGGAIGMHVTEPLNIEVNLRTSFVLRSTYLTKPSSRRFDIEQ